MAWLEASRSTCRRMSGFTEVMAELEISVFNPSTALTAEEGKRNLIIFVSDFFQKRKVSIDNNE